MPKKARQALEISKAIVHKGTAYQKTKWLLWSRASWAGDRIQKYFTTRDEAETEQERLLGQHKEHGKAADLLTPAQRSDAVKAIELLGSHATLTEAAELWIEFKQPSGGVLTVNEAIAKHLERMRRRRPGSIEYHHAQEIALRVFARGRRVLKDQEGKVLGLDMASPLFGERHIAEIRGAEIEDWLHGPFHGRSGTERWRDLNLRNYCRDIGMLFATALDQDWIPKNPMLKVTKPEIVPSLTDILTVEETAKVLAEAPDFSLLEMYSFGLFSGIRIEELSKLRWEWCHWKENAIRLPGTYEGHRVTKFGKPRSITISATLKRWIRRPPKSGLIVNPVGLRDRREGLHERAGIKGKRNPLRHSFASYHASRYKNPGLLQIELGQKTPSVLWDHYIVAVTERNARRFLALAPKRKGKGKPAMSSRYRAQPKQCFGRI